MSRPTKMPPALLLALTLGPAILIGTTLWFVTDLIPACTITEEQRLPAPDGQFDLVVFSRDCGDTAPNSQAALVPPGEAVPVDAASFVSIAAATGLTPRWQAAESIDIALPPAAEIFRQDASVAGIAVTYR